ncbi:MAG: peroxiredoxin [Deltaproteobacteria bacterium]|nr:peroxiredoxin [Deltaproteobacteria bacterium]
MEATQQRPLVRLNEPAPDFEANTTQGPIKLSDFKGKKWVVLFSHPADFTPVCTTEFIGFSNLHDEFVKRSVQLIGLSIDSIYAHLGWLQNIEQNFNVKVPFPVIADLDMKVASLYGMIHPGASSTATVRAVFIIDDKGMLRAMVYYPLTTGRNMDEILRVVDALQLNDKHGVATPANWKRGEKVIVPPPTSVAQVEERKKAGYEMTDWYFSKKSL